MSLTAMSLLESARRKFFMNSTYIMSSCLKRGLKRFCSEKAEMILNSHELARIGKKKIFHELYVHHV